MPFGRRRPLMRAAAVGGIAYTASRRGAMAGQQQAEEQEAPAPEAYAPPPPAPEEAPPAAADSADASIERVEQLAKLHESGVLTDEEFAAAKAKALGIA
jgi:putative oligomerization/nucleic acid binding protein